MDGMAMMLGSALRAAGIDVDKAMKDFESLKSNVENTLQSLQNQYALIIAGQERMEKRMEEIWKANQTALSMSSQVRLLPQQVPQEQPTTQQERPA